MVKASIIKVLKVQATVRSSKAQLRSPKIMCKIIHEVMRSEPQDATCPM